MLTRLQEEVVQGPDDHPRFGKSLWIRPTLETARAGRFPTQALVVTSAARRLIHLHKAGDRIQAVIVHGEDKDPTTHPEFPEISQNLRELVNKWFPKANLVLLSENPDLRRAQARHALNAYDLPILRLAAGTQKTFKALTGEDGSGFRQMVEDMGRLDSERLIVEVRFVQGKIDNTKDNELRAWIRKVEEIRPAGIQLTTPPRTKDHVRPVPKTRMAKIAELVTEKTGIPAEVCVG